LALVVPIGDATGYLNGQHTVTRVTTAFNLRGILLKENPEVNTGARLYYANVTGIPLSCKPGDAAPNELKTVNATVEMQRVVGSVKMLGPSCKEVAADVDIDEEFGFHVANHSRGECSCNMGECPAGNLVADAIHWSSSPTQNVALWKGQRSNHIDFSLTNSGPFKLKAQLMDGDITSADAFNLVPDLADVVLLFDVPASMVWAILAHSISFMGGSNRSNINALHLHASESLYVEWDLVDENPILQIVEVNGTRIGKNGEGRFTIATNAYIANFNIPFVVDGVLVSASLSAPFLAGSIHPTVVVDTGRSEFDALVQFLEESSSGSNSTTLPGSAIGRIVKCHTINIPIGVYCEDPQFGVEDCAHIYHMIDIINDKHDGFLDDLLVVKASKTNANDQSVRSLPTVRYVRGQLVANRKHVYVGCSSNKTEEAWKEMHAMVPFPLAVFGIPCSDETGALSSKAWRAKQQDYSVVFSHSSTAAQIADEDKFPLVARLSSPESITSNALHALCATFGWNRVAIVHDNSVWGAGAAGDFIQVAKTADPKFEAIRMTELDKSDVSIATMKRVLKELVATDAKIVFLALQQPAQRELFRQIYNNRNDKELNMYTSLGQLHGNAFISTDISISVVTDPDTQKIDFAAAMGAKGLVGLIAGSQTDNPVFKSFQTSWSEQASKDACFEGDAQGKRHHTSRGGPYCDVDNAFDTFGGYTLFAADQIVAFSSALDILLQKQPGVVPGPQEVHSTLLNEFGAKSTRLVGVSGSINFDASGDRIGSLEIQNFQIEEQSLLGSGAFYKVGFYVDDKVVLFDQNDEEFGTDRVRWVERVSGTSSTTLPVEFQEVLDTNSPTVATSFRKLHFPGEISFKAPPADRQVDNSVTPNKSGGGLMAGLLSTLVGIVFALGLHWRLQYYWKRRRSIDFTLQMKRLTKEGSLDSGLRAGGTMPREIKRDAVHKTQKVGGGEFGEVWKGILDESATREAGAYMVAVKSTHAIDGEAAEELQREAIVMAVVGRHPNLVSLIGVVTKGPPLLLVIALCEHGSLLSQLKKRAHHRGVLAGHNGMDPKTNFEIAKEVANGMAALSGKRFVHRDLAARNVLIDSALVCKIADFGLSRKTKLNDTGAAVYASRRGMFPLRWTAPEAMCNLDFSTSTDVWSFGVLVMELYEDGQQPYCALTNTQLLGKLTSGWRAPRPTKCPPEVFLSVLECWAAEPSDRPTFDFLVHFYGEVGSIIASKMQPQPQHTLPAPTSAQSLLPIDRDTSATCPKTDAPVQHRHPVHSEIDCLEWQQQQAYTSARSPTHVQPRDERSSQKSGSQYERTSYVQSETSFNKQPIYSDYGAVALSPMLPPCTRREAEGNGHQHYNQGETPSNMQPICTDSGSTALVLIQPPHAVTPKEAEGGVQQSCNQGQASSKKQSNCTDEESGAQQSYNRGETPSNSHPLDSDSESSALAPMQPPHNILEADVIYVQAGTSATDQPIYTAGGIAVVAPALPLGQCSKEYTGLQKVVLDLTTETPLSKQWQHNRILHAGQTRHVSNPIAHLFPPQAQTDDITTSGGRKNQQSKPEEEVATC
jgi:serine/threonine protein kinase/ABC-type branched-subunit amino acid transport system substrate-binding protein